MRTCTNCKYRNIEDHIELCVLSGRDVTNQIEVPDFCPSPSMVGLRAFIKKKEEMHKEQKCQCYTCIYAPNDECGWYAACNNCIDGSNYWRKNKEDGNDNAT